MARREKPSIVYWLDDHLYLNITNQCSNSCWFCFRNYKQGVADFNLKLTHEPVAAEVIAELEPPFSRRRWGEIVFCGFGEPTARLNVLIEVAQWIKGHFSSVPIRLDTNGHGYALNRDRDVALELKAAGVSKASVSLNGYSDETYNENCRSKLPRAYESVLEFISKAKTHFEVEVTAVRMPEVDIQKVKGVADGLEVPFRVRDYVPCFW